MSFQRPVVTSILLLIGTSLANVMPPPPLSVAQRAAIEKLALTYGYRCDKTMDYRMDMMSVTPSPVSRLENEEKADVKRIEATVYEGWKYDYERLGVERKPTFVRYHYTVIGTNGYEAERLYQVNTYHVKNGKVVKAVTSSCHFL